jgi:hypothetical protein
VKNYECHPSLPDTLLGFVAKFWEEMTQAKYESVKLSMNVG